MGRLDLVCVGQSYGYLSFGLELVSANQLREQGRQPKLSHLARSCSQLSPSLRHNTSLTHSNQIYQKERAQEGQTHFFSFFFKIDPKKKKSQKSKKDFLKEKI